MSLNCSLCMKCFADRVQASEKNVLQYNHSHGKLVLGDGAFLAWIYHHEGDAHPDQLKACNSKQSCWATWFPGMVYLSLHAWSLLSMSNSRWCWIWLHTSKRQQSIKFLLAQQGNQDTSLVVPGTSVDILVSAQLPLGLWDNEHYCTHNKCIEQNPTFPHIPLEHNVARWCWKSSYVWQQTDIIKKKYISHITWIMMGFIYADRIFYDTS